MDAAPPAHIMADLMTAPPGVTVLAPGVYVLHGFASPTECASLDFAAASAPKRHFSDGGDFDNRLWRDGNLAARLHDRVTTGFGAYDRGVPFLRANTAIMAGRYGAPSRHV